MHVATCDGNWETKHIVMCLMHWIDYADGEEEWLKEHERQIINMCSEMLGMEECQRFKIWDAVEEHREAAEKQKPKKPDYEDTTVARITDGQ